MRVSRLTTIRFMLAVGSVLLFLAAVAPVSGYDSSSCSAGSYIYSTSNGQCHAESANSGTSVTIPPVNLVTAYTTAETPAPVVTVTVPVTPTKSPVPALLPVLGIGIMCVIWGIARKNR